jgi:hypothetical protein
VLARVDGSSSEERVIYLPLPASVGRLYFQLSRPDEPVGANDFYVLRHFVTEGLSYQLEEQESANDTALGAELAEQTDDEWAEARVMGELTVGDVDYWSFEAMAGDALNLGCYGARFGSGLVGMHVAVLDAAAPLVPLAEETETASADLRWSSDYPASGSRAALTIPATGTYLLRVDLLTGSQDPEVVSDYYRCNLWVVIP